MQTAEAQFHDNHLALAKRLFAVHTVDAAFLALKAALVCAPGSTAGVSLFGHIGLLNGGGEGALQGFRRALMLDGRSDPRAWMNYGNALVAADKAADAVDVYHTVLHLDPNHVMAMTQLSVWHLSAGEVDLARSYISELLTRADLPPRAALRLADALRAFGAKANAQSFYDRAICPTPVICCAAYFGRAMVLRRKEAPKAAIADFQRAIWSRRTS